MLRDADFSPAPEGGGETSTGGGTYSPWWQLMPLAGGLHDEVLERIERELAREETRRELAALDDAERYPAPVIDRLRALGMSRLFAEPARATSWHLCGLNEITARAGGSLTISVGINGLALLPVWIAGNDGQKAHVARRLLEGTGASLLLSELAHGSNLARNEMRADPGELHEGVFQPLTDRSAHASHYRLRGEKHLINGATQHRLWVVLARTRDSDPRRSGALGAFADFSIFLVDRDEDCPADEARALPRFRTMPTRGADISGARFEDLVLPRERMVGERGQGLMTVNRTLVMSRGGVGAFAAGTAARAHALALDWARTRDVYGEPIVNLDAIGAHLLRSDLAATASAALSLKSTAAANALGQGAAHITAAAKLACCVLAEEAVTEGRRILGARAMLRDHPFEPLVRDVMLFGAFDGTSHVMLEQLSSRLAQGAQEARASETGPRQLGAIYLAPPRALAEVLAPRSAPPPLDLVGRARAMASAGSLDASPLLPISNALLDLVSGLKAAGSWADQANRFHAGLTLSFLEALMASLELGDPERRRALGLAQGTLTERDASKCELMMAWLGSRVLRRIRALALSNDLAACARPLEGLEERLRAREAALSRAYRADLKVRHDARACGASAHTES